MTHDLTTWAGSICGCSCGWQSNPQATAAALALAYSAHLQTVRAA